MTSIYRNTTMVSRCWRAIVLTLAFAIQISAQLPNLPTAGFLGTGYGWPLKARTRSIAPGGVTNFYFTGVPFVTDGGPTVELGAGDWPIELRGYALEFDNGREILRAPIGRVTADSLCATPGRADPACTQLLITAQVPDGVNLGIQSRPSDRMTLVSPSGRSGRWAVNVTATALHLLSAAEFLGRESSLENVNGSLVRIDSPRAESYLVPGDRISVYAWGLGTSSSLVEVGKRPAEPIPVPIRLIANFHFGLGLPVLRVWPSNSVPYWLMPSQVEARPEFVRLTPGKVGVYEIGLIVPEPPPGVELPVSCASGSPGSPIMTVTLAGASFAGDSVSRGEDATDGFSRCVQRSVAEADR